MTDENLTLETDYFRSRFKYKSVEEDLRVIWESPNEIFFGKKKLTYISEYPIALDFVYEAYLEHGFVEQLVNYQDSRTTYSPDFRICMLAETIVKQNKPEILERLFTDFVRKALSQYFLHLADDKILHKMVEDGELGDYPIGESTRYWKTNALTAYTDLINYLEKMNLPDRVAHYKQERQRLEDEDFKKPLGKPDTSKIDKERFWAIINESREQTDNVSNQLIHIGTTLEGLNGVGIRSFAQKYSTYMKKLYHYNVLALGYAALGGCGDDKFDEFRLWLILQGDPKLLEKAIKTPIQAAPRVPANLELPSLAFNSG